MSEPAAGRQALKLMHDQDTTEIRASGKLIERGLGVHELVVLGDELVQQEITSFVQIQQSWDRMSEGAFDKVMGVNLDGVITMTRLFWPMLVASDAAYVVNTSSIAGFIIVS